MISKTYFKNCFKAILFLFPLCFSAQNLLVNGDFESGGNGVGFNINGAGYSEIIAPFSGNTAPGNYAFTTNPFPMNTANFIVSGDHTSGSSRMMIIDGNSTGGNQRFWRAGNTGGGICGLTIGTTYTFRYWIRSVSNTVVDAATQASIGIQFNNVSVSTFISGNTLAPLPTNGWQQVIYTFVPNNSCVNIELWNTNTNLVGNDFAVDDFSVTAPSVALAVNYSVTQPTCPNANDASISVYGSGGVLPYVSYSITGPISQTSPISGLFTSLVPGTYSVSVTDSNIPPTTTTLPGVIIVQPTNLTLNSPTTICSGSPTNLSVTGGTAPYTWTASPADGTLTTPNSATPTVSPTQTTTYTATSTTTTTRDLIFNGNFSQGNTGFTTDYQYLTTTTPFGAQKTYGITTNANSWFAGFSSCTANSGVGNMMVMDGSTTNAGNDKFWCQTVPVIPGQNYTFTYYVQTVATPNPANIDVVINGVSIGTSFAPVAVCGWVPRTYVWNSGLSTTAQICMYDRVITSGGNDFAIDDISFTTSTTCNLSNNVIITVNNLSPAISCSTTTANSILFNWGALTGATSYTISYTINSGIPINGGSVLTSNYTVTGLSASSTVVITVTPVGTGCYSPGSQTCSNSISCPTPVASVTVQPTCTILTGTIVVSSPSNPLPLPPPSNLFISEVTDEDVGSLTYVEIYNGTGVAVNLANYKLKVYNNGNAFNSCGFPLVGTLNNNSVYVIAIGSAINIGGVVPNLVVASCAGVNDNDNIRLTTSADVEVDLWGRTDGVVFTPSSAGYTYRRLATAPHPTIIWNSADWTSIDPQVYTNVGSYIYAVNQYEYSINDVTYQPTDTFFGVAPGTYNVTIRDVVTGCVSNAVSVIVNPTQIPPTAVPVLFCDVPNPTLLAAQVVHAAFDFNNAGQTSFTVNYTVNGLPYGPFTFASPSNFNAITGVIPGDPVVLTITWDGLCTPSQTITCYPTCYTPITPTFTQVAAICSGAPLAALPTTSNNNVIGVWTPAINNTATTTYTFTPNAGECGTTTQMTITVNPVITPTFTAIAPICNGSVLAALPTTSTNGITGSWSPVIDNTATTTYTFTPTAGQCVSATLTQLTITVNPIITPVFNAIASICSGTILAPLPTTSTNGITGSWSPTLNNTTTTTYTFTPTAGQCTSSTLTTLTITVTSNSTPTFTAIAPICSGDFLAALPTTSNNGVTGIWTPVLNNTTTTTYTFSPTLGLCASPVTLTITIIPKPTPTFSPITPICSGVTLLPLPTTSNNGITGTWSPLLDNTVTTNYTFTPTTGICATTATLQIVVTPQTTPVVTVQTLCNNSLVSVTSPFGPDFEYSVDGGAFQSSPIFSALTVGLHSIIANQISSNCLSTVTNFTVLASINDVVVNIPQPLQYCDPNNDGFGVFDLTQVINSVTGGAAYTVTFHETQIDALIDGTSIASPINYSNININTQTIYIRVESNTTTCFEIVQLQLIVNPTPEATQPQDYHVCDDNFDGFAVFDLSVINSEVLGSISAATHLVTYHTSLPDAQAGVGAITNILNYTNTIITTQTLWIRVETTATGCYDIVTLQLVVDPLPQSTQPAYAPYSLCDTTAPLGFEQFDLQSQEATILLGQLGMSVTFYPSLAQAQAQIGAIPSGLYTNIAPFVQTLGVVITNTASGCYVISTMDIRVEPLPTPIPPLQAYAVCDNDQDGFSQFDLCTLTASINSGYLISYHETQPDAQSNNNALACIYNNILSFTQIIWVRAEDTITHCVSTMPIVLQVDASPIMPTPLPTLTLCDTDSNNQNGITSFDLSQQTAALLAAQTNAAINYSVTYYNSQIAAQSGVGNIVSTTTYQGFDSQVIWVRIEHNATGCFIVGSFTLEVNIPLLLTTPTPLSVCDNDANPNDLHTTFDLTVKDNQITTGLPGYTVMYYPTYANALAGVNLITNPTAYINVPPAVQTIGVAVTSADGCKSYITLDIRVLPVPTPNTNPTVLVAQCENALNSGVQTMDITVNSAYIINSDPNVTLHYYHSLADATSIPPMNEILTPTAALIGDPSLLNVTPRPLNLVQNVYVVVSSNLFVDFNAQNCYTVVQQPFIINPLPLVVAIGAQQLCEADPTGNDGFEIFDLTDYNADLLAGNVTLPASNYTVSFYTDAALTNQIATPTAYTNTTNPQTIYAQVTNTSTGCSNSNSFDIIVNPKPLLTPPLDFSSCDDEPNDNDGFYLYPLDALVSGILNGQSPGNFTVSFYHTQADADATPPTNAIIDLANYQAQSETIWIRVENNTTGCYQIGSFDIIIEQYASPVIETVNNINTICVNFITSEVERSLTLFASNETVYLADPQPSYDYQWFIDGVAIPGAVSPGYTIDTALPNNESAVYTVSMTTTGALGCSTTSQSFTVYQSGPAVVAAGTIGYTVTDAFTENQIITVTVEGWGDYQYSLDDGPRQDSPVFENVSLGSHLITVWDTQGGLDFSCDALVIEQIQTIDYPHYFTPNGDGIHDTWNIVGLEGQPSTKIYIFDRFGKLIKQISSTGQGWDGTYNGQQLPSTDYWFTVDYNEQESQKQFRAHFTLKR